MTTTRTTRKHTAATMARARFLREAGWTYAKICDLLEVELGRTVHRRTVQLWCNPEAAETHRQHGRRYRAGRNAATASFRLFGETPEYHAAFIRRLRDEGVTWCNVVRVCRVVFPGRWTVDRAKRLVGEPTTWDRSPMKVAA